MLALSTHIHAAKKAFDPDRQISDCVRVLEGYWPRFILAYRPPTVQQIAERESPRTQSSPPQTNEGQQPTPGIGDRFKGLVPFLR